MKKFNIIEISRDNKDLIWVHPTNEISANTKLFVPASHTVILATDKEKTKYSAGTYDLYPEKSNFFKKLLAKLGFGKIIAAGASVYYVNNAEESTYSFDAKDMDLYLFDSFLQIPIEVRVSGLFNIKISDAEKIINIFGAESISAKSIYEKLKPMLYMELKHTIAKYMLDEKVDIYKMPLYLKKLSEELTGTFTPIFENIGVELVRFIVSTVQTNDEIRKTIETEYMELEKLIIKDSYLNSKAEKSMELYGKKAKNYHEFGYCGLTEYEKDNEVERDMKLGQLFKDTGFKAETYADPKAPETVPAIATPIFFNGAAAPAAESAPVKAAKAPKAKTVAEAK